MNADQLTNKVVVLGTRPSRLARWQTDWVRGQLQASWPRLRVEVKLFTTAGDRVPDVPLPTIGTKGLFTTDLERGLHAGEIDLAVHSLKDLPVDDPPDTALGAICARADARDVLVFAQPGQTLADLPQGARVGTCSLRRSTQLLALRPDLTILPVRGNVDTRLAKVQRGDYDAIVLAAAGLIRLGLGEHIGQYLSFDEMLPAPGQAALAVQCRADDVAARALLAPLDDPAARAATTAERSFLQGLGGGCSAPVAAYAETVTAGPPAAEPCRRSAAAPTQLELSGLVARPDGRERVSLSGSGSSADAWALGQQLAQQAMALGASAWL